MKKRIWNRAKCLGMSALLLTSLYGTGGQSLEIRAADVDNSGIYLTQTAQWVDQSLYQGEIITEISGLNAYRTAEELREETHEEVYEEAYEENYEETYEEADDGFAELEEEWAEDVWSEEELEELIFPEEDFPGDAFPEEVFPEETDAGELSAEDTAIEDIPIEDIPIEDIPVRTRRELYLVTYISEYFQPDMERVPSGFQTEPVTVRNQTGGETTITKAIYPIDLTSVTEDILHIVFPVILREEYRNNEQNTRYPVIQDEPLEKDCSGPGAYVYEGTENGNVCIAQAYSPTLEVQAAQADFAMELLSDAEGLKAGRFFTYELKVQNTGALDLSDIEIESSFCKDDIKAVWEYAQGVQVNGKSAVINRLPKGETSILRMTVKLTEEQDGTLAHRVHAKAPHPSGNGAVIEKEVTETVEITPLIADFTVEKTADRREACPGDTVTYQICIRNTGERTLHSVLTTEKFLESGIQAQFVPKDGVVLNSSRTQALISQIDPGQAFALQATVVIPTYMENRELINEVVVVSRETGEKSVQSQSAIQLNSYGATPTPYTGAQSWYQAGIEGKATGYESYQASSKPKTGDDTEIALLVVLGILALMSGMGAFWQMKGKSRH